MIADVGAHLLQQSPNVERGCFAAVCHVGLRTISYCEQSYVHATRRPHYLVSNADNKDAGAIDSFAAVVERERDLLRT